ncbi:ATP-dependent helicase [Nocardioides sp. Bht2]|uniref:ATP-dependent helicase n=1 Tax=Nocardioides sp. Bht2 TaxID=3392297 RepID=UPI0039B662B4
MSAPTEFAFAAPRPVGARPVLDEFQQQVVDHPGGPLLVLAGPGTGKTTTLVEAIAHRIESEGVDPDSILVLTFSRKAAQELRDRLSARLARTTGAALCATFHSFAYGLIRQYQPAELFAEPLRLLTAAEQEVVIAELLADTPEAIAWPENLRLARETRGFAREVGDLISRAREKGLDGLQLAELGDAEGVGAFSAGGRFLEQYLEILDADGAIDYSDLLRRATLVASHHQIELRSRYRYVFVDEYQDTDPGQVELLQTLAGQGGNLTAVGDPHQSIYAFRGAELRGILDFPDEFRTLTGEPAAVVSLRQTRRFGSRLLRASRRLADRLSLAGSIPAAARDAFLNPIAAGSGGPGRVEAFTFETERSEAEHLADLLRRAHLEDGIGWSEMAILVRSGSASIPPLRRALAGHGVPVEVAADDTPLVRDPAVRPLLSALDAALHLDVTDPESVGYVDAQRFEALLASPLSGLDVSDLRTLSRTLRSREKEQAAEQGRAARSSPELLRACLAEPDLLDGVGHPAVQRVQHLVALLHRIAAADQGRASAHDLLWQLWEGTSWPERLRYQATQGGPAARMAHRDLDAICALFETAQTMESKRSYTSATNFLRTLGGQQIPADTLAEHGVRGDAVRLLTAHRSKGLEWRLVVVAHVQEGGWPDLRRRSALLHADRIGRQGLVPEVTTRDLIAEERRLFYVACTRARDRLVVTAVQSPDDEGDQPSRFISELTDDVRHLSGRPRRPLSLAGLVAELRRTVSDPSSPAALRAAAARRLADLAGRSQGRQQLAPSADPANWWGTRALSSPSEPLRPAGEPVVLSASAVSALLQCPARWFWEREAGGAAAASSSQGFGLVVHTIAERIGRGELTADPGQVDQLMEVVDSVWGQMQFRTPWTAERERAEVRAALARFVGWHSAPGARTLVATEQELRVQVSLPDGERVSIVGFVDRLEIDDQGQLVIVDLKTGKYKPTAEEVRQHPQLALYQYAAGEGGFDRPVAAGGHAAEGVGGAELVHLRLETRGKLAVQRQEPALADDNGVVPVEHQLMGAASAIRDEVFPAVKGSHCDVCTFHAICPAQRSGTVLS